MQAAINKPLLGWKRQRGRPRRTGLRAVEEDQKTENQKTGRRCKAETPGNVKSGTATPHGMPYDDDDDMTKLFHFISKTSLLRGK